MIISEDLYRQIVQVMPIPCVDVVVEDQRGRVLLVRRTNEPARGAWWFPGGRVHFMETRSQAAMRKLSEECGIQANSMIELGTYDVIVAESESARQLHGITTLFCTKPESGINTHLDAQSSTADWRLPPEWLQQDLNPFVRQSLQLFSERNS